MDFIKAEYGMLHDRWDTIQAQQPPKLSRMPVLEAQVEMNLIPNPDNSDNDEMDNIEEEFERAMLEIESPNTRKARHQAMHGGKFPRRSDAVGGTSEWHWIS